jgi:predicted membrane channel-forming protein YqfA (hemolysin III family)
MAVGAIAGVAVALLLYGPIPQDPVYHHFADRRPLFGVPNGLNVLSNASFALVGALGLAVVLRRRLTAPVAFADRRERWFYVVFFVGVGLTAVGSAYYHLAPDNARLVWDRVPITLAFMAMVAAVVAERIDVWLGLRLLAPLLALGLASVLYWHATEQRGAGDLRLYVLVQFVPLLVVPLLLALYDGRYTRGGDILSVVAVYGVAKLFELGDGVVFGLGHVVSGHTLKHLTAAGAAYGIVRMLERRMARPA